MHRVTVGAESIRTPRELDRIQVLLESFLDSNFYHKPVIGHLLRIGKRFYAPYIID